jgi:hypothetical protein
MIKHFNTKHGKCYTKEYESWHAMMQRCYNANTKYYDKYGGRGIKVCDEWHNPEVFLNDMGLANGLSLDRIDNNGNYEPSNCRWATKQEQNINRSNTNWIEFNGEKLHLAGWAKKLNISSPALCYRIKKFGVELAISTPLGRKNFAGVK